MSITYPIYLDYMATTPIDHRVLDEMLLYMREEGAFGNPASHTHIYGIKALEAVEQSRARIAHCVGSTPNTIIFTSGATESNNLAIMGTARFHARKGKHLITQMTEHKAVLDSFSKLEKEGFEVTYLKPNAEGLVQFDALKEALRPDTILVSLMHVNNEIGVIQDIEKIGHLLRPQGILFHVDAAQSLGKVKVDLSTLPVDLMSFSAHKVYGPKGIGALFVRDKPRVRLEPLSFGGGHEHGLRSGTLPTHQIVGMAKAIELALALFDEEHARIAHLQNIFAKGLQSIRGVIFNGSMTQRVPHNLNITIPNIEGSSLLFALKDLALSSTSACASMSGQPSYVLRALGRSQEEALSSIRISLGRYTTLKDVERAIDIIKSQVERLSAFSVRT